MTPEHLTINQKAVLQRIEDARIDETSKMFFRTALERGIASTNGRTHEEKIQDLTEQFQTILQLNISRELIAREMDTKIEKTSDDVAELKENLKKNDEMTEELKENLKKNDEVTFSLAKEHKEGGKFSVKTKTNWEIIGDTLKDIKWALCILGLGICAALIFRPEIASILTTIAQN